MSTRQLLGRCGLIGVLLGLPFALLHLVANPDDAPITPLQHLVAALANFFGPWGVALVRIVDFPNAGWREFSCPLAIGLTLLACVFLVLSPRIHGRAQQYVFIGGWTLFMMVWLALGFGQIASGLL
jgi:hypothetical protein